jgi:hypothetical protein
MACLLPPVIDEIPAASNRPPRILPETLQPGPTFGPERINVACPTTFQASASDDDDDLLYVRAFVDYYNGANRPEARNPEVRAIEVDPTTRVSREPIKITPSPESFGPHEQNTIHTIELFVADRDFSSDKVEDQDGRLLVDVDGLTDSFLWPVQFASDEELPCAEALQ